MRITHMFKNPKRHLLGASLVAAALLLGGCANEAGAAEPGLDSVTVTAEYYEIESVTETGLDDTYDADHAEAAAQLNLELIAAQQQLSHAINMADEVRLAMAMRIYLAGGQNNAIVSESYNQRDQDLHDALVEIIPVAENVFSNADSVSDLESMIAELVAVYEPNGPYPNLMNLPESWLRNLPNGDPRNLPRHLSQGVGPEGIRLQFSTDASGHYLNNDGSGRNPYRLAVTQLTCHGPQHDIVNGQWTEIEAGGSRPSNECRFNPRAWSLPIPAANLVAIDVNEQNFSDPLTHRDSWRFRCTQVPFTTSSEFTNHGFDLVRDDNGYAVWQRIDECAAEFSMGGARARRLPSNGDFSRSWDGLENPYVLFQYEFHGLDSPSSRVVSDGAFGNRRFDGADNATLNLAIESDGTGNAAPTTPVDWFSALAPYGRDWSCTYTFVMINTQFTNTFIGATIDEINEVALNVARDWASPSSDFVCFNSSGEELKFEGDASFRPLTEFSFFRN